MDPARIEEADQRIAEFIRTANPRLHYHLPTVELEPDPSPLFGAAR